MKCKKCGTDTWVGVETSLCDNCKEKPIVPEPKQEVQQTLTIQVDEHWTLEQIIADAKEDDEFWESPEFDLFAVDSVRFYTQKRALLKLVDSQAQKIADQQGVIKAQKEVIDAQSKEMSKYLAQIEEQTKKIERLNAECLAYLDDGVAAGIYTK